MTAFKEQIGPNKDLEIKLTMLKPKVKFGTDPNVVLNFYLGFDVYQKTTKGLKHLVYDELKMLVTFNAAGHSENDRVDINFHTMKLDLSNKYG